MSLICLKSLGPCALMDIVGLETMYHVVHYWGEERGDAQLKKNAAFLKANFVDKNKLGMKTGEGFYKYPNPAYQSPEFLR